MSRDDVLTFAEWKEFDGLKRDGKERLPVEKYTQINIDEAMEAVKEDGNFKKFYDILSKYDIYALHNTFSADKIIQDRAIKSLKLTYNNRQTTYDDKELFNNHGFVFTSISFLPKNLEDFNFNNVTRGRAGNYFCLKLSDADLKRSLFNKTDFLRKKNCTTHPEKYQQRIVSTSDLNKWKLATSYLLYKEEIRHTLFEAFIEVIRDYRLITKSNGDIALSKLKHFAETDSRVKDSFDNRMDKILQNIEKQGFYAPTYQTLPLLHEYATNLHFSELLFPCKINIQNIKQQENGIFTCTSKNLSVESKQKEAERRHIENLRKARRGENENSSKIFTSKSNKIY